MFCSKVLRLPCAILVMGLLATVEGCGGIQQSAAVGSPTPPSPQTQELVYHLSSPLSGRPGQIECFALNEATGLLTSLSATTLPAGMEFPFVPSLVADPAAKFLFLSSRDISQPPGRTFIATYKIDSTTGMLTQTAGTDTAGGGAMVLDPTNQFLYMPGIFEENITGFEGEDIAGFQIHGDGSLGEIPGSPFFT
ncbi:MAG TPA: hypothetical protein VGJ30_12650, partial [Candidatus Angelobacter sp.]